MAAKLTHWLNLVGVFFVFLFAVFYLTMAGMVFETNRNWQQVLKDNKKKLDVQETTLRNALTGDENSFEWPYDSLKGLETASNQQVLGQGRVWRQCTPSVFTPGANPADLNTGSLTINLPPDSPAFRDDADPAAGGDDAADGTSLVYVFLEIPDGAGGYKISSYIGSFFATEPSDDNASVKLSPSLILPDPSNAQQVKAVNPNYRTARELVQAGGSDPNTRWAMYDILPVDSYDVFVESIRAENDDPEMEVSIDQLRQKLENEYMPAAALRLQDSPEKYKKIIDSIVYTNRTEKEYSELDPSFEPTEDEKWYKLRFAATNKEAVFKVDFDTGDDANQGDVSLQGQAFDRDGLALLEILKHGEDIVFEDKETVLLDHASWEKNPETFVQTMKDANTLIADDVVYRRKLNDFDYDFRALVTFNKQLTSDRDHAAAKLKQLQVIESDYKTQVATRLDLSNKLNNDVVGFKKDEAAVKQYRGELESQLADDRSEIDRYYRLTKELAAKKAEMEEKLSKLIDENTKKAAAEADGNP